MSCEGVNWIQLAQAPVTGYCEKGNETLGSVKEG